MSKKKTTTKPKTTVSKKQQKKTSLPLILVAIAAVCVVVIVLTVPKGGSQNNTTAPSAANDAQIIEPGGSLIIPIDEISDTARFYPVEVDGTPMEILAVEDSDGNIRTAFNTCQICYSSGRGYYVQDENDLVCQNCGNRFTVDQVEIESGGCNPWPIFADDKTVTEDSIEISYEFLNESKEIFAHWKTDY